MGLEELTQRSARDKLNSMNSSNEIPLHLTTTQSELAQSLLQQLSMTPQFQVLQPQKSDWAIVLGYTFQTVWEVLPRAQIVYRGAKSSWRSLHQGLGLEGVIYGSPQVTQLAGFDLLVTELGGVLQFETTLILRSRLGQALQEPFAIDHDGSLILGGSHPSEYYLN